MTRKELLFYGHLGLGDALINCALIRHLSMESNVTVLCKNHNLETVRFMLRDRNPVEVFGVSSDIEAKAACDMIAKNDRKVIRQGMHGNPNYAVRPGWDDGFYDEMKLDPSMRWSGFKVDRQPTRELGFGMVNKKPELSFGMGIPKMPYAFVHDDPERGCVIKPELLPKKMPIVRAMPMPQDGECNLFDWWNVLMNATEIHVMESCFAILADMSPELKAKRKCLHLYTRKSVPPRYANIKWEVFE